MKRQNQVTATNRKLDGRLVLEKEPEKSRVPEL